MVTFKWVLKCSRWVGSASLPHPTSLQAFPRLKRTVFLDKSAYVGVALP